jgi:hypothetical protein
MRAKIVVATLALLVGALVGGLRVGRAQAQPYPPPPPPQPMVRWQYTCIAQMSYRVWTPEVLNKLNEMGAQGWQLMTPRNAMANPDVYCFERRY